MRTMTAVNTWLNQLHVLAARNAFVRYLQLYKTSSVQKESGSPILGPDFVFSFKFLSKVFCHRITHKRSLFILNMYMFDIDFEKVINWPLWVYLYLGFQTSTDESVSVSVYFLFATQIYTFTKFIRNLFLRRQRKPTRNQEVYTDHLGSL